MRPARHAGRRAHDTPAIRALKQSGRGRRISLLTSPFGAEVALMVPEIDEVIVYDAPWMKATSPRLDSGPELAMVEQLKSHRFHGAAIFTVYSQNPLPAAFLCYLADIPLRLAHCHENPYQLLTNWVPDSEPAALQRHEVQRQIDLVETVGAWTIDKRLSLRPSYWASKRAEALLERAGLDLGSPWAIIHAGATAPSRCYP